MFHVDDFRTVDKLDHLTETSNELPDEAKNIFKNFTSKNELFKVKEPVSFYQGSGGAITPLTKSSSYSLTYLCHGSKFYKVVSSNLSFLLNRTNKVSFLELADLARFDRECEMWRRQ